MFLKKIYLQTLLYSNFSGLYQSLEKEQNRVAELTLSKSEFDAKHEGIKYVNFM